MRVANTKEHTSSSASSLGGDSTQRWNDLLTHLAFLIWAGLATYYYQERLYSDAGFFLAKVVYYESFWMELNRFLRVCSQWLPLLCLKLGLPLKVVLLAYSIGHVLFFYGIYLWGRYKLGHHQIGWLLVLTQTVGILHGFCAPGFELYYASALLALLAIYLNQATHTRQQQLIMAVLAGIIVFNYQLILFMLGGVLLLHFSRHGWQYWRSYVWIILVVGCTFLGKKLLTAHSYEIAKMNFFLANLTDRAYTWGAYIRPLLDFYASYYKALLVIIALTVVLYWQQKRFWTGLGFLLFVGLTQYIIALTYPDLQHSRYQEQCYYPLIFVGCFPLLMDLKVNWKGTWQLLGSLALFALIGYRFFIINTSITPFVHRVALMNRLIDAAQDRPGHKFVLNEQHINPSFASPSFTMGMETMLLSAAKKQEKTIQIILREEWEYPKSDNPARLLDSTLYMFTHRSFYDRTDSIHQHAALNPAYFNFPASPYRWFNGRGIKIDSLAQVKPGLEVEATVAATYSPKATVNIPIQLINQHPFPLNAKNFMLSYHWWKDDKLLSWEGFRSHFETDLLPHQTYDQYMLLVMPDSIGNYDLEVDIVVEPNIGWMRYNKKIPISIEE